MSAWWPLTPETCEVRGAKRRGGPCGLGSLGRGGLWEEAAGRGCLGVRSCHQQPWAGGREKSATPCPTASASPSGSSEAARPFRAVLRWGKGTGLRVPLLTSNSVWATPRKWCDLGQGSPSMRVKGQEPSADDIPSSRRPRSGSPEQDRGLGSPARRTDG